MRTLVTSLLAALCLGPAACLANDLTPLESRWVRGVWPVVAFAKSAGLPLDVVVQPQPTRTVDARTRVLAVRRWRGRRASPGSHPPGCRAP